MNNAIDQYINHILQSVLNTEMHEDIRTELNDHIYSLLEEYLQLGIPEKDATEKAIKSMGEPNALGNQLNNVYHFNTKPLTIILVLNILTALFSIYMVTQIDNFKIIDYIVLIFTFLNNFIFLSFSLYFRHLLSNAANDTIYYSHMNHLKENSYIENLTGKVYIIGASIFIILLIMLLIAAIIEEGFPTFFIDKLHLILMISYNSNAFLLLLLNKKFPNIVLTESGIYTFFDIPRCIPWKEIENHKWTGSFGIYQLKLFKGKKYKKVYGKFKSTDKIILNNLIKTHGYR